jgi:hypothetical protein
MTEEEKRHNCKQRLDKSSSRLWVLHIIVDQAQKMHTPEGSKHKPEESFLIEIYEVVQKPSEVCQRICNHIWRRRATQSLRHVEDHISCSQLCLFTLKDGVLSSRGMEPSFEAGREEMAILSV